MNGYFKNTADFLAKQALSASQLVTHFKKEGARNEKLLTEAEKSLSHWKYEIEKYENQSGDSIVDWDLLIGKTKNGVKE